MFVFYDWPFPHVYFAKNAACFPFHSWLRFQRLCRLLWGLLLGRIAERKTHWITTDDITIQYSLMFHAPSSAVVTSKTGGRFLTFAKWLQFSHRFDLYWVSRFHIELCSEQNNIERFVARKVYCWVCEWKKSANIWQSYKQERGCLMHFARLANTLLTDEESVRGNHVLACNFAKYSSI